MLHQFGDISSATDNPQTGGATLNGSFVYFSARFSVVRVRPLKTRSEFCSTGSFVFVRFEEAVGKLRFPDVADDLLYVIR